MKQLRKQGSFDHHSTPVLQFKATLERFQKKGEKTGWTYIAINEEQAQSLNPGVRKSYRVKGRIHEYHFDGISLLPMGEGSFLLPVKGDIRKAIRKQHGDQVNVTLCFQENKYQLAADFTECLQDEPGALQFFNTLPGSHRNYFSKWIEAAKTETTRTKRIAMAINALERKMGYADMIRFHQKKDSF